MTTTTAPEVAGMETIPCRDLLLEVVIFAQVIIMSVICHGWAMASRCSMSKLIVMGTQVAEADTKGWGITGVEGMIMMIGEVMVATGMMMDMYMIQDTIAVGAREDTTMLTHREDMTTITVMMTADIIEAGTMTGTLTDMVDMVMVDMDLDICLILVAVTFAREPTSSTYHGLVMMI